MENKLKEEGGIKKWLRTPMNDHKKFYAVIIWMLAVVFYSCSQGISKCETHKNGKAVLVAYRVSKHSHLWFKNTETNQMYDVGGVGGKREPNINLGDTISVQYCDDEIIFDKYSYVRQPYNRETRFIYMKGYGGLYQNHR